MSLNIDQIVQLDQIQIVDNNGNLSTIKPASTAAAAADTSIVMALSPNSPLPTGTNPIGVVKDSNFPTTVDINYGTVGASTIRTASQIGNATGAADFGTGSATAQTLRITGANFPTTVDTNYGIVGASTLRIASQIGNATGAANFGAGVTGAQTLRTAANLYDGSANAITSDSNGNASPNQRLHVAVPDTTAASTALSALNTAVTIAMAGLASAGFQILSGTLIGTITPECSVDGGTTWAQASFYDPSNSSVSTSVVFASSNGTKVLSILPIGGSSHVRVRVSAYTSGTANSLLRASQVTGAAGAVTAAAFGTPTNTFPAISGNTATLILSANANRKYAYISNGSGSQVNIQFGSSASLSTTTGIPIPARNFYELKGDNLFTGNIYAYSGSAVTLSICEGTP